MAKKRENVFTQLGSANYKIAQLLCKDEDLRRYLKYSIENPMDESLPIPPLEDVWKNNIRIKPLLHLDELRESFALVSWDYGSVGYNSDFSSLALHVDIFTPINAWDINEVCQRPFRIMDLILQDLNNKRVSGIGTLNFYSFELKIISNEYTQHQMVFYLDVNNSNETLE